MAITERTLRTWRQDALSEINSEHPIDTEESTNPDTIISLAKLVEINKRILRLTMELMDIRLMEKLRGKK